MTDPRLAFAPFDLSVGTQLKSDDDFGNAAILSYRSLCNKVSYLWQPQFR